MAEEYIIGNNAQFNDSVEILKDLTLYGVVENTTDFAVKIQGDEKLRITSDNFSFKIQGNDKLNIGNDNISFKTGFNIKIPNSYDVDDDGDIDVRDALYFGRGQFPSSVAIENSVQNAGIFFGDGDILRETTGSPQYSGSFALFTRNSTYDYADNFVSGTPAGGIRVGYSTAGTSGGSQGFSIIATKHDGNGTPVTMLEMGSDNLIFSGKVLRKGHTTNVGQIETQLAPSTQLYGNDRKGGIRIADFSDSPFPASLQFVKSRAGTVGVNTILQDGDRMGSIYWGGANGTNFQPGAFLTAITDGTVSSTSIPTALTFGTNAGDDLRNRIKIDPNGNFNIGVHDSTNPFTYLRFGASQFGAADIRPTNELNHKVGLAFYVDGTQDTTINPTEQLRITSGGIVQLNTTNNAYIRGGIYAKYTGASGSTANINNSGANKISWLQVNTEVFENGGFTNTATDVTVPKTGIYKVIFNGYLVASSTATANQRTNMRFRFRISGVDQTHDISMHNYIRAASGHNESSVNLTAYLNLSSGNTVAVSSQKMTDAGGTVTMLKDHSSLTFHLVA